MLEVSTETLLTCCVTCNMWHLIILNFSVNSTEQNYFFLLKVLFFLCCSFTNCSLSLDTQTNTHRHTHTHTHTHPLQSQSQSGAADDGSSCPDMISRQTALSPGLVCLSDSETDSVVQRQRGSKLPLPASPFIRPPVQSLGSIFTSIYPTPPSLPPPHRLSHCVSSLPQRWARSFSLKRIRDISTYHRGRAGHFSSLVASPALFSQRSGSLIWPDKDLCHVGGDG